MDKEYFEGFRELMKIKDATFSDFQLRLGKEAWSLPDSAEEMLAKHAQVASENQALRFSLMQALREFCVKSGLLDASAEFEPSTDFYYYKYFFENTGITVPEVCIYTANQAKWELLYPDLNDQYESFPDYVKDTWKKHEEYRKWCDYFMEKEKEKKKKQRTE